MSSVPAPASSLPAATPALRRELPPARRVAAYVLRRQRLAPLIWGVPLGLMALMVLAIFPSIQGSPQLDDLVRAYPDALKEALGISDASFSSIEGYMSAEVFSMIAPFAACWFVVHSVAGALAGTPQRGTREVLLGLPLRRRDLVAGWLLGVTGSLIGILVVLAVMMQLGAWAFGVDLAPGTTLAGVANLWPLAAFAGGLTIMLAGVLGSSGAVTGAAAGVLVLMYLVEILGRLSDTVGAVDELSAFHYYGSAIENGIRPGAFAGLLGAALVLGALGAWLYERRDLRA